MAGEKAGEKAGDRPDYDPEGWLASLKPATASRAIRAALDAWTSGDVAPKLPGLSVQVLGLSPASGGAMTMIRMDAGPCVVQQDVTFYAKQVSAAILPGALFAVLDRMHQDLIRETRAYHGQKFVG